MVLIQIVVSNTVDLISHGSETCSLRALDIKTAIMGPNALPITYTLHHLATHAQRAGRAEEAEARLRRALDIEIRELGGDHKRVATTLQRLGDFAWEAGLPGEEEELLKKNRV